MFTFVKQGKICKVVLWIWGWLRKVVHSPDFDLLGFQVSLGLSLEHLLWRSEPVFMYYNSFWLKALYQLPWVPEDIFFLIDTKAALTQKKKKRRGEIIIFSSALCASLTRLRREPSVSIRKKYPLEPRVCIDKKDITLKL